MYELKKIVKVFTSKFVRTVPSSYKKRINDAAVSQRLRNTHLWDFLLWFCLVLKVREDWSCHHCLAMAVY